MGFHPKIVKVWHTFNLDGRYQIPVTRFQFSNVGFGFYDPKDIRMWHTFLGSHLKKVLGVAH
jgi:hypothetical protein